ncbi:MAG TPA: DUF3842 family protein [Clostridiales bacterium]|nr:DUF3842 family protein [Clostridiales bacterium]
MKIAVIDGQGGGIGKHITETLRKRLPENTEIIGLGTNTVAMANIMKAGANEAAAGENAIAFMAKRVDLIVGSVAILVAGSMCGEVSAAMAAAIGESPARKILLPINRCNTEIIGAGREPVPHQIEKLVERIGQILAGDS